MRTIILLTISNTFMNLAWYGHLKFRDQPLWLVILASWGLAFFEYLFQVPANRIGINEWTLPQLKVLQECITLVIFTGIAFVLFRSPIRWNIGAAYLCIVGAVYFAFFTR
ncbi:MAG TPA: DMT family protein [Chthoniobacterales bacterium]|nr:DMT family protein [Chthoniobacterales bacterium]